MLHHIYQQLQQFKLVGMFELKVDSKDQYTPDEQLGAVKVLCLGVRGDNKRCCLASWRSEFS